MQKITPHLWYDKEAKEAAEFYTSFFPNSKITNVTTLHNTPSGDCDIVSFELCAQDFMSISAGPLFKLNPSVSFHVKCRIKDQVDKLWKKLSENGAVLMELDQYPYGWLQDKYGVSWQLMYAGDSDIKQQITPVLMFFGDNCGKAGEAINFYTSVFSSKGSEGSSKAHSVQQYEKNEGPDKEGTAKYAQFTLLGQDFGAMDSAHAHNFKFNEAISLIVNCDTQEEIDYYWNKLSTDPKAEQCGWLKDKFGFSWQIEPRIMQEMMKEGTQEQIDRLTKAFLKMKKFDIAELKQAYVGN